MVLYYFKVYNQFTELVLSGICITASLLILYINKRYSSIQYPASSIRHPASNMLDNEIPSGSHPKIPEKFEIMNNEQKSFIQTYFVTISCLFGYLLIVNDNG